MPKSCFPEYSRVVEEERSLRAGVFCGAKEFVFGVPVVALTPMRLEYLIYHRSPFLAGGKISPGAILQFLWFISSKFDADFSLGLEDFVSSNFKKLVAPDGIQSAIREIDGYIENTFMDSPPDGPKDKPFFAMSAHLIFQMSKEPFRWHMNQTLATPIRIINQLIKARDKSDGQVVVNHKSDRAMGRALAELQRLKEVGELTQEEIDALNGGRN